MRKQHVLFISMAITILICLFLASFVGSDTGMKEKNYELMNATGVLEFGNETVQVSQHQGKRVAMGKEISGEVGKYSGAMGDYPTTNITNVTNWTELESSHPYGANTDHMWVYKQEGAVALSITFSAESAVYSSSANYIEVLDGQDHPSIKCFDNSMAGRTVKVWGDTIKIHLVTDGNIQNDTSHYGFKVTDCTIPTELEKYEIEYEALPTSLYVGDTQKVELSLVRTYLVDGQPIKEKVEDVRFVWDGNTACPGIDANIDNTTCTIRAVKAGYGAGFIRAYLGNNQVDEETSSYVLINVKPLIEDRSYMSMFKQSIYVNQISQKNVEDIYVRQVEKDATITNVTSSDDSIIKAVEHQGSQFSVEGLKEGTASITVSYTVQDGDNVINSSSTYAFECKECEYKCEPRDTGTPRETLLQSQTNQVFFDVHKFYYNEEHTLCSENITNYSVDAKPVNGSDNYVSTTVSNNMVTLTAINVGTGSVRLTVYVNDKEIYATNYEFKVIPETFGLEYEGPSKLYAGDTVAGPVYYRRYGSSDGVHKEIVEDAKITCVANDGITYNEDGTLTAKENGNSRYTVRFECNGMIKDFYFTIMPLVRDEFNLSYKSILVNQKLKNVFNKIYVRDKEVNATITSVSSSDSEIISVIGENNYFTIKGEKEGNADVVINYSVYDGNREIKGSRTISFTCYECIYSYRGNSSDIDLNKLLRNQTIDITVTVNKTYFDEYNRSHNDAYKDFTIVPQLSNGSDSLVSTKVTDNKLSVTARAIGSGKLTIVIKVKDKEVGKMSDVINIVSEYYQLEYHGPAALYPYQVTEGPALYHYYTDGEIVKKDKVEDAIINCTSTPGAIYNTEGTLTAGKDQTYIYLDATCSYKNSSYNLSKGISIRIPEIIGDGNIFVDDTLTLQLQSNVVINKEYTLTWRVQSYAPNAEGEYVPTTETFATITTNADGTATIAGIKEGAITVTATYKKGNQVLWTSENEKFAVNQPWRGIRLPKELQIYANRTSTLDGWDYSRNNNHYKTEVTEITSSNPSMVEVLGYQYYNNDFTIDLKGKTKGMADITVKYTYWDDQGNAKQGEETTKVTVSTSSFTYNIKSTYDYTVPGGQIPMSVDVNQISYDEKGVYHSKLLGANEYQVQYKISNSSIATIDADNNLVFNKTAVSGDIVKVYPIITVEGAMVENNDYYEVFRVESKFYQIQGDTNKVLVIKEGETKTLSPALYEYSVASPAGALVNGADYLWYDGKSSGGHLSEYSNDIVSAKGMVITGTSVGHCSPTISASYQDEQGVTRYIDKQIEVMVVPNTAATLTLDTPVTVTAPGQYYKLLSDTKETYCLTSNSEDPKIIIYDEAWNVIKTYNINSSDYSTSFSVHFELEGGKTYYIFADSTYEDSSNNSWPNYTMTYKKEPQLKQITDCTIAYTNAPLVYNGKQQLPTIKVLDGNKVLQEGVDYTVLPAFYMVEAGMKSLRILGLGEYGGSANRVYTIAASAITDANVQLSTDTFTYNGQKQEPGIVVTQGDVTLEEGKDYIVQRYGEASNSGINKILVKGIRNYSSSVIKTYTINKLDLSSATISDIAPRGYIGKAITPTPEVKLNVQGTDVTLVKGLDYALSYENNVKTGTATITIKGVGNYSGTIIKEFTIYQPDLSLATVTGISAVDYIASHHTPIPKVKLNINGSEAMLVLGTDYTATYQRNEKAGTATVTITGINNYIGTITKTFVITPVNISSANITKMTISYTGRALTPTPVVKVKVNGALVTLQNGIDYTVTYTNNVNTGTAGMVITGKGYCSGQCRTSFAITASNQAFTVAPIVRQAYIGKSITPKVKVKVGSVTLKENRDYKVSYKNNKLLGTATITVTGIRNYRATRKINFSIYLKTGTIITSGNYSYKVTSVKGKLAKVTLLKMRKQMKSVKVVDSFKLGAITCDVTAIASKAFAGVKKMQNLTLGRNVTTIGNQAFSKCTNLKRIYINGKNLRTIGKNSFYGINRKTIIRVPKEKLKKYKALFKGKGQSKSVVIKE